MTRPEKAMKKWNFENKGLFIKKILKMTIEDVYKVFIYEFESLLKKILLSTRIIFQFTTFKCPRHFISLPVSLYFFLSLLPSFSLSLFLSPSITLPLSLSFSLPLAYLSLSPSFFNSSPSIFSFTHSITLPCYLT